MLAEALAAPGLRWPMPPIPLPPEPASGARRARQRHAKAVELRAVAERPRVALNMMMDSHYDASQECPARGRVGRLPEGAGLAREESLLHRSWERLLRLSRRLRDVRRDSLTGASLAEGLAAEQRAAYLPGPPLLPEKYTPLEAARVDEPPPGTVPLPLRECLPGAASEA